MTDEPKTEPTLSLGAIERNVLPVMDLLERAAELIHDPYDGLPPEHDGQRWLADYRKLCRDE